MPCQRLGSANDATHHTNQPVAGSVHFPLTIHEALALLFSSHNQPLTLLALMLELRICEGCGPIQLQGLHETM